MLNMTHWFVVSNICISIWHSIHVLNDPQGNWESWWSRVQMTGMLYSPRRIGCMSYEVWDTEKSSCRWARESKVQLLHFKRISLATKRFAEFGIMRWASVLQPMILDCLFEEQRPKLHWPLYPRRAWKSWNYSAISHPSNDMGQSMSSLEHSACYPTSSCCLYI